MLTAPDLPEPGEQSLEDRRRISRRFIIHAREELEKRNRLQAGEKAWGAVVQPLKAIAERRGWPHQSHRDIHNVGLREALSEAYRVGHQNFYENYYRPQELPETMDKVEDVMPILESLPGIPPRPFTIAGNTQLQRLRSLTGDDGLQLGDRSAVGFSLKHGLDDPRHGVPVNEQRTA